MKFHRVKVENLNSLYGVQTIDFEEDVRGSALFLIVGPTGAGKSTILDAICLALFGQTPRLERRVGRSDTDVAHIMSIGTASAYAEVEFSTLQADGSRHRYLAAWSARRAYDDPEGAVQRPERSLYRKFPDGSMKLVVSDHREKYYQPGFDEALRGLSVDDFKRSILLAQGEFSAFLHAADGEKASILERLTNTDNYRRIGQRAARQRRAVDDRHRKLMTRLEEMQVLTLPQEAELREQLDNQAKASRAADLAVEDAAKVVQWLQKLEELEARLEKGVEAVEAATKALEARSDDVTRLEKDAGLQDVEPAWREVERSRDQIEAVGNALAPVEATRAALAETAKTVADREKSASHQMEAAAKALEDAQPAIRKAHELRTRRDEVQKRHAEAMALAEKKHKASSALQAELTQAADVEKALVEASAQADAKSAELEKAKGLLERLPAIRASFTDGVEPLRQRATSLREQLASVREERAGVVKLREQLEEQLAEGRKERGKWQAQVTRAQNKLDASIDDDRDASTVVNELTATLNAATQRAEALREARYLLVRIDEQHGEREELELRLKQARAEVEALAAEEGALKRIETAQRAVVRSCEESLRQNERVIALSAYRRDLESGNPCPLCGSPLHPYCESMELADLDAQAAADRERLEKELADARTELSTTNEQIQRLAGKFVARTTAVAKDDARSFAIRSSLEADQRAFSVSAERAGYAPLEAFRLKNSELLEGDLEDATRIAKEARVSLDAIEQARQAVASANEKLNAAQEAFASVEKNAEELDEQLRKHDDRIKTRESDIASCDGELERASLQVLAEIGKHAIEVDGLTVEEALSRAENLRVEVRDAADDATQAREALKEHRQRVERLAERHESAKQEVAESEKLATGLSEKLAALAKEVSETLGGREPAAVKKELDQKLAEARTQLAAAQKERTENAEAISANNARREELTKQRDAATKSLEKASTKLDETLKRLGLEQSAVELHLLAPEVRKRLRTEIDALNLARTRAVDRRDDAKTRLELHNENPLAPPELSLTEARDKLDLAREHANAMTLELGALRERWDKHEQTKSRRGEIEDELKAVQHELDVWTTIYGLIGMRDGESFKLFAQSLNLQGLVDNANARLQKLHARYELTVARGEASEPTLSFMVRDRYQANVERPLTTLSGGETFLVSLALALGLADFRRIDMPIETLLLDEGFGSLDQDSLHMALTTLHQLHRDASRQIGIISHVDALKELIDARIVVEPRGHGRSTLRFEFGAHTPGTQLEIITL